MFYKWKCILSFSRTNIRIWWYRWAYNKNPKRFYCWYICTRTWYSCRIYWRINKWITGDFDADSSADDIEKYHKTYIDEKDFAVSEIKKVFEDAIDIDASFSDKTEDILEDLKALISTINKYSDIIKINDADPKNTSFILNSDTFNNNISNVNDELIEEIYDNFIIPVDSPYVGEPFQLEGDCSSELIQVYNWDAIYEILHKDADEVSVAEYQAMVKLLNSMIKINDNSYEIDTDALEKFIAMAYNGEISKDKHGHYVEYNGSYKCNFILSDTFITLSNYYNQKINRELNSKIGQFYTDNFEKELTNDEKLAKNYLNNQLITSTVLNQMLSKNSTISYYAPDTLYIDAIKKDGVNLALTYTSYDPLDTNKTPDTSCNVKITNSASKYDDLTVYSYNNNFENIFYENTNNILNSLTTNSNSSLLKNSTGSVADDLAQKALSATLGASSSITKACPIIGTGIGIYSDYAAEVELNTKVNNAVNTETLSFISKGLCISGNAVECNNLIEITNIHFNKIELQNRIDKVNSKFNLNYDIDTILKAFNSYLEEGDKDLSNPNNENENLSYLKSFISNYNNKNYEVTNE